MLYKDVIVVVMVRMTLVLLLIIAVLKVECLTCVSSPSGLNVHSMLKHEAVVLTLETVKFLEDKLLWHDKRYAPLYPYKLPYSDFP